ncbi:MAG: XamI family restriction endonuclease [Prevotella sp.]|nr:XamI family restriction endonuclease [Prevotella sp.]MBR1463868.1 XamI family restriction endonuclease [Prevotella sp.]
MKRYSINKNNTGLWKTDVQKSVIFYNEWFLNFAPSTYVNARQDAINKVENAFQKTECFNNLSIDMLRNAPETVTILRMATTPPLARDRLMGLADVPKSFIKGMEEGIFPVRMPAEMRDDYLCSIIEVIRKLLDVDVMPWLETGSFPHEMDRLLATHVIGDRVCGSLADPIIRNEQERRQLESISRFLSDRGYTFEDSKNISGFKSMPPGTFTYHLNVPAKMGRRQNVNMPIDVVIMRKSAKAGELPLLIECKSAGDFTNTNKRRKEEATKIEQLKNTYGKDIEFILFLCGYFDSGYLGYEAAEGIDWVWEHRIVDLEKAGI